MQLSDIQNPAERKKLIAAAALGLLAIILLWWAFFGFGGGTAKVASRPAPNSSTPGSPPAAGPRAQQAPTPTEDLIDRLRPINFEITAPAVSEAKRNIFAYYEAPKPQAAASTAPTATPTPTPPLLLANLSPNSVYARTGDFTLEVSGDKFTPSLRIVIDNTELPTRYISAQQLSATVPAALIANPAGRQILVRSADGKLYSNSMNLAVNAPPTPNFSYVGIIGTRRYVDTAILQDKGSKEIVNVQRGDLLGGRFRVTSISEKELVVVDNTLKIKHTLPFSVSSERGGPQQRATPKPEGDDDEP